MSKTTAIGSLPHHNIDAALAFAFEFDIPFLPQIPVRNPWEYMIPQALEGLPGLEIQSGGLPLLNVEVWEGRNQALNEKILEAFSSSAHPNAFSSFEPSPASSSSWQAFLWELEEMKTPVAKLQLAGPLTCEWALRYSENRPDLSPITDQIFRLVLARSVAMVRRLTQMQIETIFFIDEPALFSLNPQNPKHLLGLQELKLMVQTLQKENTKVGIHCCSQTHWPSLLDLKPNFLSIDCALTLQDLSRQTKEVTRFLGNGGNFSFGIIPTSKEARNRDIEPLLEEFVETMRSLASAANEPLKRILERSLLTPACGLALHSPDEAQAIAAQLKTAQKALNKMT